MLLLEREARKETIERKGKNYRFWLFRRKLYHIVTVYALIFGLIGAIVFLWKDYILKYDWLSIDTVTLKSNGIFNSEQAFSVMGIGPQDNIFFHRRRGAGAAPEKMSRHPPGFRQTPDILQPHAAGGH